MVLEGMDSEHPVTEYIQAWANKLPGKDSAGKDWENRWV